MEIPDWLSSRISTHCKCGALIYNNEALTVRKCWNGQCPYHMAEKISDLAKYFHVKGVGPATALEYITTYNLKSHLAVIPYWFKDKKPRVSLYEVAKLAMIMGHDKDMYEFCNGHRSFEEVYSTEKNLPIWFIMYKDTLMEAETYFDIKPPLSKVCLNVMMTGEVKGYPSRAMFISHLNDNYGQYVQVVDVGFRKTNVHALIKEETAAYHRKTQVAEERGIKIVTPASFEAGILAYVKECQKNEAGKSV